MQFQVASLSGRWQDHADPMLVAAVAHSHTITATDHIRAQLERARLHNVFARFHEKFDLLVTPALPLPAFEVGDLVPRSGEWGTAWCDWAPFSYPFNLTTQPAASVPCGLTSTGLPIGVQIVGAVGADALVLRAARALEAAMPFATLDAPRDG
jgi:aspartyl-tRNA(Asn)/glutamyl-tRNA(Gln) amidotransferase subunit A